MKIPSDKAAGARKTYKEIKEHFSKIKKEFKQKTESSVNDTIPYAENTLKPAKINVLRDAMVEAEKDYLLQTARVNAVKRDFPNLPFAIFQQEKELSKLEKKAKIAVEKYNIFALNQKAAQQAFEILNIIKK